MGRHACLYLRWMLLCRAFAFWSNSVAVVPVGSCSDSVNRITFCDDRNGFLAQDSKHRFVQLLLHAFFDAAVFIFRCLFPSQREVVSFLALGCRSAPAAASRAVSTRRVQWTVLFRGFLGRCLH